MFLEDCISTPGAIPNSRVIEEMKSHDIFLFTSNRYEGWGVVANEAMLNGCILVCSNSVGASPFLVEPRETGCVFRSGCLKSLETEVEWLLSNPNEANSIRVNARRYMDRLWTPKNAVTSLLSLSNALMNNKEFLIDEGPCSKA